MKRLMASLAAFSLVAGAYSVVLAAEDKMTPQQEKMKACNTQAGDKKGDERNRVHAHVPQGRQDVGLYEPSAAAALGNRARMRPVG